MTSNGWLQIVVFSLAVLALTKPLGVYMFQVFEGPRRPLERFFAPCERLLYRLAGVDPTREQTWQRFASALIIFSVLGMLVTYAIQRLQPLLPFNPQNLGPVSEHLAFNTAASFTTNTNWQSYSGEATMSYLTQMAGLAWHNFVSAAAGIGVALAIARGLTRRLTPEAPRTVGNFWVDLVRSLVYLLIPLSLLFALVLVSQGVIQNLSPYVEATTLEGGKQTIAMGPVASQEVIKQLGTNGGGFFNANSAHPFENPTPLTNLIEMLLIFAVPAGLTYTFGRMAGEQRQGWAIFAAMAVLFAAGVAVAYWAEAAGNPVLAKLNPEAGDANQSKLDRDDAEPTIVNQGLGNMEGKEVRFGIAASALFAAVTTDASCGAVNSMHDSFTPLGGMVPLINMQLGEVIFGGVGAGLYGMLVFVLLSVFIAGLMVGRTPEYLGKKIEAREVKLAMLYALIFPLVILVLSACSVVLDEALPSLNNAGPHGLSEVLYAYTSGTANNGSAFAGLSADKPWWNTTLGFAMLAGRFLMIVPVLSIAGSMVAKKTVPPGPGTFPTTGPLFTVLLLGVVLIVGALTFFPALSLGPIVEHFLAGSGKLY
jgi:K+-transporting ATPase ATPase A chain